MATLKDVAKASGLTVGTVSRVLNNRGYISDKTREKVYQVMKELNYQPNEMARSLSKQKNNTIGIIYRRLSILILQRFWVDWKKRLLSVDIAQLYLFLKIKKNARKNALKCAKAQEWQE